MQRQWLGLVLVIWLSLSNAAMPNFKVCTSKSYALCTAATCQRIAGSNSQVLCVCDVKSGYSLGEQACADPKKTPAGNVISSRYYPYKNYMVCHNNRAFAMCLDDPCVVSSDNPNKAFCTCTLETTQQGYARVTDKYDSHLCTTDIISSAPMDMVLYGFNYVKDRQTKIPYFPPKQLTS